MTKARHLVYSLFYRIQNYLCHKKTSFDDLDFYIGNYSVGITFCDCNLIKTRKPNTFDTYNP
jgi:hypothetical protein